MQSTMSVALFANLVLFITTVITLCQGIILAVVRSNEPVYRHLIFKEFLSWFGEVSLDVKYKSSNDARGKMMKLSSHSPERPYYK